MNKSKELYDDQSLISKIRLGDAQALRFLYQQYYPMIRQFVILNSGEIEDAEELYQDAIITLYEKILKPDFQLTASLKTYLYSICRNKWLYLLRTKGKQKNAIQDSEKFIDIQDDSLTQEQIIYEQLLPEIMSYLTDTCRELLKYFYYANFSMVQIAEKLGYNNENTAKSKKNKCMEKAREKAKELLKKI